MLVGTRGLRQLERLEGHASGRDFVFKRKEHRTRGLGIAAGQTGELFFEAFDADMLTADRVI
jgi:hypothetical protein